MMNDADGESAMVGDSDRVLEEHRKIQQAAGEVAGAANLVELLQRLQEFRSLLAPHFVHEEAPDGFFDLIRARASRHLGTVQKLEGEHQAFLAEVDRLAELSRAFLAGPLAELLRQAGDLAKRLAEHESRESALLLDALYVDDGAND